MRDQVHCRVPRHRLYATHAGAHALLGHDVERADHARLADVSAAAKLAAEGLLRPADAQDTHHVAILLAEERDDPLVQRFVV